MRLSKRFLFLFLAFWLPVSVVAAGALAASMPGAASQEQLADAGEGCPQHATQEASDSGTGNCYSCSFCQFACTALISVATPAEPVSAGWVAVEFAAPVFPLPIPEPLQRPPLSRPA